MAEDIGYTVMGIRERGVPREKAKAKPHRENVPKYVSKRIKPASDYSSERQVVERLREEF